MLQEIVELSGHLIDSDILRKTFARIVEDGGEFEVLDFKIGKTNEEPSSARLAVRAADPQALDPILESLAYLGASRGVIGPRATMPVGRPVASGTRRLLGPTR